MHLLSVDNKNQQLTLAGLSRIKRQVKSLPPKKKKKKKSPHFPTWQWRCPDSGACTGSDLTVEVCSQVPLASPASCLCATNTTETDFKWSDYQLRRLIQGETTPTKTFTNELSLCFSQQFPLLSFIYDEYIWKLCHCSLLENICFHFSFFFPACLSIVWYWVTRICDL